jgi:CheY-like chemotaxis protein
MIEMRGCRVIEAGDGLAAVGMAIGLHPDLIVMDTHLPQIDGLTATQRIRGVPDLHEVPIVFLSGDAQPAALTAALATGGDDYIIKPFDPGELEDMIEKYLGKNGVKRQATVNVTVEG